MRGHAAKTQKAVAAIEKTNVTIEKLRIMFIIKISYFIMWMKYKQHT